MLIRAKKGLGQNFLVDKNIQEKIANSCGLGSSDLVLEIGSGSGQMTRLLAQKAKLVWALEIDRRLIKVLQGEFGPADNVKIIQGDILKFDLKELFCGLKSKIKVIGNIPYYITTPIIERLLEHKENIEEVYLTVQKEFAERVAAKPGSKQYGSLSCFLQYNTEPEILFLITKGCFRPQPKVDSAFLKLKIRSEPAFEVRDERVFTRLVRTSFNQRRKTLRNSLKGVVPREKLDQFFQQYHLDPNIRPEMLSPHDFANLSNL